MGERSYGSNRCYDLWYLANPCASFFLTPGACGARWGWWCGARWQPGAANAHHTTNERPERKTCTSRYYYFVSFSTRNSIDAKTVYPNGTVDTKYLVESG